MLGISLLFFFFQAEDGIRDDLVTGVQTCALPICLGPVVWGLLGFLGLGSLYKHIRITLGKKMVPEVRPAS